MILLSVEDVKFSVVTVTGKYGLQPTAVLIFKQLYISAGEKDGDPVNVAHVVFEEIPSETAGAEQKATYTLQQQDIDAHMVRFMFTVEIERDDLIGLSASTNFDGDKVEQFYDLGGASEPEPALVANIGMTSAVTVTRGEGNRIDIDRHDGGEDFHLLIGSISPDGSVRYYNADGYIRDNDRGQTYAVVERESDGMVVRVWIAPDSLERIAGSVVRYRRQCQRCSDGRPFGNPVG